MISFLSAVILLILGYLFYGMIVEKVFSPKEQATPAIAHPDSLPYTDFKDGFEVMRSGKSGKVVLTWAE